VMSVSVCLSFCEHISSAVGLNFTKFSVAYVLSVVVARFSASALRCASLLYTSVFVDDVIFPVVVLLSLETSERTALVSSEKIQTRFK